MLIFDGINRIDIRKLLIKDKQNDISSHTLVL